MLEEFAREREGKLVLNVVDPLPFSEERTAPSSSASSRRTSAGGEAVYFGLARLQQRRHVQIASRSSTRARSVPRVRHRAPRLQPRDHRQDRRRLAVERADRRRLRPASQQPAQPWVVVEQAKQVLEVRTARERARSSPTSTCSGSCTRARRQHAVRDRSVRHARRPSARLRRPERRDSRRSRPDGPRDRRRRVDLDARPAVHAWGVNFDTASIVSGQPLRAPASAAASNRCAISA